MITLNVNNKVIRARASVLALLYYREAFGTDMLTDVFKFASDCERVTSLMGILEKSELVETIGAIEKQSCKIIWAMHKAQCRSDGVDCQSYAEWLKDFGETDITTVLDSVLTEIYAGFYCAEEIIKSQNSRDTGGGYNDYVVIISCKNMGFSLDEMNELTIGSYTGLVNAYSGNARGGERIATQADIDRFF